MTGMDVYRQMMADPSCTLEDLLMAYARDNIDVARQMTNRHATVYEPMDCQELKDYLSDMDPVALVAMGHNSPMFDSCANWFAIKWDDEIVPISNEEAESWFLDNFREAIVPMILAGSIPLPDDIQRIVSMWDHRGFSVSDYDLPPYRDGKGGSRSRTKAKVKPKSKLDRERSAGKKPVPKNAVKKTPNRKPAAKPGSSGSVAGRPKR